MVFRGLKIFILGIEFDYDAYVLGFSGYGMILGMDWLSTYEAILDCERRVVRLETCSGRTVEASCDPQGSVMLSFLYSLDSSSSELDSVPIVRDFPDVLEEIRRLSPKREIDFRIYLTENAKPVALPVRHMASRKGKN